MTLEIEINNIAFILHNTGALYWPGKKMLLLSDVHLGKVSHFRKHGSAIPNNAMFQNFKKLDAVVKHFEPESICFLGDLFHSSLNKEWILFEQWVSNIRLPLLLIAGNHDIISPHKYEELNIAIHNEWILDGFLLTHHPETREGFFNLSGHVHPAVQLQGMGRQFLKLPCFFRNKNQMILPAFGEFTGTYVVEPQQEDIIYITTKEEVIRL
ncbi:ligase-associated DNA damage response endonuclease PdeM [Flavobacterium beibuense]|uniref:Metallophosphoesterase n=1 Tax=Flavobacterium beibuense TaxID=657326 RepID=A0A444WD67_9FLAO|nr:ligase-associated DNA damage response endonuclease PdeM [Flavobacterium beibuense]RYJ43725.1 Metallophosphoesterase [Flavobacterium beibuense]